jgi:hypothetical protein
MIYFVATELQKALCYLLQSVIIIKRLYFLSCAYCWNDLQLIFNY